MTQAGLVSSTEDELDPTLLPEENQLLNPFIILIPVGLVVLIIAAIVGGIVISRRCNTKVEKRGASVTTDPQMLPELLFAFTSKKLSLFIHQLLFVTGLQEEDPYLDGSAAEKVPM